MFVCIQFMHHVLKMTSEHHEVAQGVQGWGGPVGSSLYQPEQLLLHLLCVWVAKQGSFELGFWTSLKTCASNTQLSVSQTLALVWRPLGGRSFLHDPCTPFLHSRELHPQRTAKASADGSSSYPGSYSHSHDPALGCY